jgi:hypothetical protein
MREEVNLQGACDRPAPHGRAEAGSVDELVASLGAQRASARIARSAGGATAGGVTLSVPVADFCSNKQSADYLLRRVSALARDEVPVTLTLDALGEGDAAINRLEDFCAALRRVLASENLDASSIGISLSSQVMPLQAFLLISTAVLGTGPRYAMLSPSHMRHHEDQRVQEEIDQAWSFLWRRRTTQSPLLPAYATSVTTRCALLNDEKATAVLPTLAIQAPPASAWLPIELRLCDFSDGRGRLSWESLQQALRACVDIGDRLLDHLSWADAGERADACMNRRLAVVVGGIGDLVIERGADPTDLRTLQWIDGTVLRISKILWHRSRALARCSGVLPALLHSDPTAGFDGLARRQDWQRRWKNAVLKSAVRNRNLFVLSPSAVLPTTEHAVTDFIDLLPVLRRANAFSFANPVTHGCRNAREFAAFHRRAFAAMERRNAASLVAAGA